MKSWHLVSAALVAGGLAFALPVVAQSGATPAAQSPKPAAKAAAPAAKKAAPATAKAPTLVLEPRAIDLLKAMSARLAAAKSIAFTAVAGYEFPSKLGPPLVYTTRYDVLMKRPNGLRVIVPGDGPAYEFYYDGKTMLAFAPAENLAAVADAPPTVEGALQQAYQSASIYFPFSDLLFADPYSVLADGKLAFYIGPSGVVGGVKTEMVAWANDDVFIQVWIGVDDKLPRRMRATYRADPLRLRHDLELTNWQLDGPVAADAFTSLKAAGAGRMAFATPTIRLPPGMKPVALKKSGSTAGKAK